MIQTVRIILRVVHSLIKTWSFISGYILLSEINIVPMPILALDVSVVDQYNSEKVVIFVIVTIYFTQAEGRRGNLKR